MKIAFWSNGRGRSCVTSNLACISVLSALNCPKERAILFENHKNIINLESTLFNYYSQNQVKESFQYQVGKGLERILHLLEQGEEMTEEHLYCLTKDYLGQRLFYLPMDDRCAENLEYYLDKEAIRAMEYLEQYSDYVFVDTASAPLGSSRKILQQSDFVVVNLYQNQQLLDHFFRNYSAIQERAFYLIGNYDEDSQLTRGEIMKRYQIPGCQIGVIPHNANFSDAISDGNLIPFLLKNYTCDDRSQNYKFMKLAKEAVDLMRSYINIYKKEGMRWKEK